MEREVKEEVKQLAGDRERERERESRAIKWRTYK